MEQSRKISRLYKNVNAHHAGQKLEIYVANKWKLQQHSRANKQTKLGRYFTIQTARQNLMECAICNLQYLGKNETLFKIRLNNHKKDLKDPKAILPDKHFQKKLIIDLTNP